MALYVSPAKRFGLTLLVCAAVAVFAAVLGWAIGRNQVPSVDERVQGVQSAAARVATDITRLDIEYPQALAGGDDGIAGSVLPPLDDELTELRQLIRRAPWLRPAQRNGVIEAVLAAKTAARNRVTPRQFRARLQDAAQSIRTNLVD